MRDLIRPQWPARVGALVTTAASGDMATEEGRARLRAELPGEPRWLHQVHGARVVDADQLASGEKADASVARNRGTVCVVKIADCMPVLFADEAGTVVGAALVIALPELLRFLQQYYQIVYGLGIVALMIFMPEGLTGLGRRLAAGGNWRGRG